jgi:hypothetical protein
MKETDLTGWERKKAIFVKWVIVRLLSRISPFAILALCLEAANLYYEQLESREEGISDE